MVLCCCWMALLLVGRSAAFNVDIPSALSHRGPAGSYFGFSVDVHRDRNVNWFVLAPWSKKKKKNN